jgi:hypothetical protein
MQRGSCVLVALLLLLAVVSCSDNDILKPDPEMAKNGELSSDDGVLDRGADPRIIPPHARPHGKTYGEWSELWWQWMASAPPTETENPVLDQTGELIDYAQTGSVWFIAGSVEEGVVREATIPTGKMLFVCLSSFSASTYEGYGETEEELRATAAYFVDFIEITSFIIDGVAIDVGEQYRVQSEDMFCLTVPDHNIYDWYGIPTEAGTICPVVADGYYAMLAPLSAGDHTLYIAWTFPDLAADVSITLHVVGGH